MSSMNIFEKLLRRYEYYLLKFRVLKLKVLGAKIGSNLKIYGKIYIVGSYQNLSIGDNCTLNEGVLLNCRDKLIIGNNCRISAFSQLHTAGLNLNEQLRVHYKAPIILKDNVWIASNCIINPNITIDINSVVGAGSVVTHNIKCNSFYAGVPARKIKEINI